MNRLYAILTNCGEPSAQVSMKFAVVTLGYAEKPHELLKAWPSFSYAGHCPSF
jgi:hypothetical protein